MVPESEEKVARISEPCFTVTLGRPVVFDAQAHPDALLGDVNSLTRCRETLDDVLGGLIFTCDN